MRRVITHTEELPRMFSAAVENVFTTELGVASPKLLDYIAQMLVRFVRTDAIFSIRNPVGQRLTQVSQMMVEADERPGHVRVSTYRHIGDFILFWAGFYPEELQRLRHWNQPDALVNYTRQGQRSYHIVSQSVDSEDAVVYRQLSEEFDVCVDGLRRVRQALNN